ncbi:alpha/beta hydrolase family protein [Pontibacillus marinus]|uniref:Serine aminopeptidase S33 domain-containing protein n=1 Tax=Pontibacillus marinus BH030004 = DSM 16465 TaxID=1385511 RepID=A0A0A5GKZ5_9BACI|nr:alpha/beta hydrolase [Pontibacillus marinus]KGX91888.1 hypothetical protein N783_00670 [Pontibacillus marinus BH030004 = DSM 16465]
MNLLPKEEVKTIRKTLKTTYLFDGFWDRWVAHGLHEDFPKQDRKPLTSLENWIESLENEAIKRKEQAETKKQTNRFREAEQLLRQASLYYNLIYWVFPQNNEYKQDWYKRCKALMKAADDLSSIETKSVELIIDGHICYGRTRYPKNPKGCIIIINPIDSSKEELYKYEMYFNEQNYITVSFDGPGQGETYLNGLIGTRQRWEAFVNAVIDYSGESFPDQKIYLFGTSLGASWALYGSAHPLVEKVSAVSPGVELENMNLPKYFMERMDFCHIISPETSSIPYFDQINYRAPVLLFHGGKDPMVPYKQMELLFKKIPYGKQYVEYPEESHCCNHKIQDLLKLTVDWFEDKHPPLVNERGDIYVEA